MKRKILILNLTRIGDLLQTTPLLAGLKEDNPDCEITLLGNVKFIEVCKHVPNIDHLMIFDVMQFQDVIIGELSILDLYRYLDNLVDELREKRFDVLINLSHSRLTAAFGRLLKIKEVHGFYSTAEGYRVINDPWLIYFSAFLAFRRYSSFNIVDIYQLGGGVKPDSRGLFLESDGLEKRAKEYLENIGIKESDRIIGLQAGASLKERRWPPEKFAASADIISRRWGAKALLFGTASEKELGDRVACYMKEPSKNLLGKTSLEELIGLVKKCDLLLTNDTGTMHIAAAVGTPVVALFMVHAFGSETGPYSEGNIIIEPDINCFPCSHNSLCPHYACFDYISPEEVADAADLIKEFRENRSISVDDEKFPRARLLVSFFDEAGFIDLRPLKKRRIRDVDIFTRMYRYFFTSPAVKGLKDDYWVDKLKTAYELWPEDETKEWVEREKERFGKLAAAARKGLKIIGEVERNYRKGRIDKVRKQADDIAEVDREIEILGNVHEELKPIGRLFELGKENMTGGDVGVMLIKTGVLYRGILSGTSFITSLLDKWAKAVKVETETGEYIESTKSW